MKKIVLLIIILLVNICLSSKLSLSLSTCNNYYSNDELSGYFQFKFNELKMFEFKKIGFNKNKFEIGMNSISLPKGMDLQFLIDNQLKSILNCKITNCICKEEEIETNTATTCKIEILELYQPIPYYNSEYYINKTIESPNSLSFDYFKFKLDQGENETNDGRNIKKFKSLKTIKNYNIDYNSLKSPYRNLNGFDNKWYDSEIGLNNTLLMINLKAIGNSYSPNKYNGIYYNQNLLVVYSKVEFCYQQFPEPTDFDPYFIVRRVRDNKLSKCSPPTGVVIAIKCKPVSKPICSNGLSLISYQEPLLYCPMYSCDIPIHYYK